MRASPQEIDALYASIRTATDNTMRGHVSQGEETEAVQRILLIIGFGVDQNLLQNVAMPVLNYCIQANMVVDDASTQAARNEAMAAVEPVIYKQGQNEVFALNGLSAVIEQGEFLAILGPSGSGKSTLLHILGGLDSPTKGSVIIDGADISEYSDQELAKYRRKTVGFVFQSFNLLPALTVQENIEMPVLIDEGEIDNGQKNRKHGGDPLSTFPKLQVLYTKR